MQSNERVLNWAAWARDRKVIPISCRGLESHYKAPPMWEYPELRVEPDINDAWEVEKTLTEATFPKQYAAIIAYAYVYPWLNFSGALRRINRFGGKYCTPRNFKEMLHDAELILHNRLRFRD